VPLPKFPLFVVALVASYKKETAEDIAASHLSVLNYCSQSGMSIISIGSDGPASEILALCMVQSLVNQYICFNKPDADVSVQVPLFGNPPQPVVPLQDVNQYICFNKPDADVSVQVPLFGNPPQPVVPLQDPKHARKTAANQLLSGARLLSFGKFYLNISHLVALLGEGSPLYS
jgi:hypothetical protein